MTKLELKAAIFILKTLGIIYRLEHDKLILNPLDNPDWIKNVGEWQKYVKLIGCYNQGWLCMCEKSLSTNGELHHAVITKGDVIKREQYFIHDSRNTIVLHTICHKYWQSRRQECKEYLAGVYGREVIDSWLKENKG